MELAQPNCPERCPTGKFVSPSHRLSLIKSTPQDFRELKAAHTKHSGVDFHSGFAARRFGFVCRAKPGESGNAEEGKQGIQRVPIRHARMSDVVYRGKNQEQPRKENRESGGAGERVTEPKHRAQTQKR